MFDENIRAELIYDGTDEVRVPSTMEDPGPGQMIGTAHERLGEVSGRVCYESMGLDPVTGKAKGRSSKQYHEHIKQVKNHSVYEHCTFTVNITGVVTHFLPLVFINRPGIWYQEVDYNNAELTINHRSIIEWASWTEACSPASSVRSIEKILGEKLYQYARLLAPSLYEEKQESEMALSSNLKVTEKKDNFTLDQAWVSLYLSGSRGFSHEQCRHGDFTAISQRCLAGDSVITCVHVSPTTGKMSGHIRGKRPRTIENLYDMLYNPRLRNQVFRMYVRTLDESTGLFTAGKISDIMYSGVKECFEVTLEDDKTIKCTKDHRIMTDQGWKTLGEIVHPELIGVDTVQWDKDTPLRVGVNGHPVVGMGLYKDVEWMRRRFVDEGATYEEMAAESECTPHLIRLYLAKHGIRTKRGEGNLALYRDREWLFQRYHVENKSLQEMADESRCSTHVIRTHLFSWGYSKERSEINRGRVPWNKDKTYSQTKEYSPEAIERYRLSKLGEKNPNWKGGKGTEERRAFQTWKRENRKVVFERDGYRCKLCNRHASEVPINSKHMRKRRIEIHHIIPIWNRPDLACEMNNVATVCWECHCGNLLNHELEYVEVLQKAISCPVEYRPSDRKRKKNVKGVKIHYKKIIKVTYCGPIETFDLVLEGENHGFVANGVVVHNSSRFCDETESPYVMHPLVTHFIQDHEADPFEKRGVIQWTNSSQITDQKCYLLVVNTLQEYLKKKGVEGTTARKQARGAARGYLGNALFTDMIFSANARQWRWIVSQRASAPADAEIRNLYAPHVLQALQLSRYGYFFDDMQLAPSPDGIGQIVIPTP
jgi:thymidylate synthase ThyX/intein/homing endonuclease